MLEPHRHLVAFLPKALCHLVQHMGGCQVAHSRSPPPLVFQQIVIEHDQYVVCVEIMSLVINDSQSVRISVRGNADIAIPVQHIILEIPQSPLCGRRHLSAEQGVVPGINGFYGTPCNGKNGAQSRQAHTVHGINGNAQISLFDGVHVDHGYDVIQILIHGIDFPDHALPYKLQVGWRRHLSVFLLIGKIKFLCLFQVILNLCCLLLIRVPAPVCKHLDTVIDGRIMAGCHHHAVAQLMLHHIEHYQRSGRAAVYKPHPDSLVSKYFAGPYDGLF